jgi:LAO/AO transport system kinase
MTVPDPNPVRAAGGTPDDDDDGRADRIRHGDVRAAARLMRWLDDGDRRALPLLRRLYPHTGRAHIVGITGNPGSGKSTLVDRLIAAHRRVGRRVGVVAVDPTSPFSGGAILGDRIRMQAHATDPGVFIRSLATRGHLGGLSRSTNAVVQVLDAMGFDVILVETVGVGQDEVEVIRTAHTSVVIVVPGLGDDIQAIKAGILEIADVFVVNKADQPGSDQAVMDLRALHALQSGPPRPAPEILKTVAARGEGVAELVAAVERHRQRLQTDEELRRRLRDREHHLLRQLLGDEALRVICAALERDGLLAAAVDRLVERSCDPYSLVDELLDRTLAPGTRPGRRTAGRRSE